VQQFLQNLTKCIGSAILQGLVISHKFAMLRVHNRGALVWEYKLHL
jgi:hypothetical protein